MSILDNVRIERSGMKKAENQTISTEIDKTGEIEPQGLATKEEYVITVKIRYYFWCNNAQLEHAARTAEKALLNEIYGWMGFARGYKIAEHQLEKPPESEETEGLGD